jgi:hypothetical protein
MPTRAVHHGSRGRRRSQAARAAGLRCPVLPLPRRRRRRRQLRSLAGRVARAHPHRCGRARPRLRQRHPGGSSAGRGGSRGHRVDSSQVQLRRARRLVPAATLLHADITSLTLPAATFDAVVCLSTLIHLPLEAQPPQLGHIAGWLRPWAGCSRPPATRPGPASRTAGSVAACPCGGATPTRRPIGRGCRRPACGSPPRSSSPRATAVTPCSGPRRPEPNRDPTVDRTGCSWADDSRVTHTSAHASSRNPNQRPASRSHRTPSPLAQRSHDSDAPPRQR